jgi:iron complex outermembrane receptor protein
MRILLLTLALLCASISSADDGRGSIEGRVTDADGRAMAGVGVEIQGTSSFALTDDNGRFEFTSVRAGTYSLVFTLLDNSLIRPDVAVSARARTNADQVVDWQVAFADTVTVYGVSRRRERIVEAPAAVTTISEQELEEQASHGLLPKTIEFTPGVDITQINLAEFLVNTRGFNSALNRRVPVLIDGRDLTDPFIGAMEWATVSYPIDEFAEFDLVRGPTSALYGANATSGIINITTRQPRESQGGMVRLAAGELDSVNAELRWAGSLGNGWYTKVSGGRRHSRGYSESRNVDTEYSRFCESPTDFDCLQRENIPLFKDDIDITFGALRFDKYLSNGSLFTLEGGTTDYGGTVFISTPGRGQLDNVQRPWARFNFTSEHWNVLAYYTERDAEAKNLVTTNQFLMKAENFKVEFQTDRSFLRNKIQFVGGGSFFREDVDSNIIDEAVRNDEEAVFAQVDWTANRHLKLVGGLRWDDGTLFESQISPKAAAVVSVNPSHSLRLTYTQGFQLPTYGEFFLSIPLAPVDLDSLNQLCIAEAGVDCGLGGATPSILSGNESLKVEQVQTIEAGYKGILGSKAVLTLDVYENRNDDFVTSFLPQLDPILGPVNPNFGPWVGPGAAESTPINPADCPVAGFPSGMTVADCVRAGAAEMLGLAQLTNKDAESIVLLLSLTNFGEVDTRGADVGFNYLFTEKLRLSATYSWFDFDIVEDVPGLEDLLLPNAPENKASIGLNYTTQRWNAFLRGRWVDEFPWINATYGGVVESFTTADLNFNYRLNNNWQFGLNVANAFDEQHWEAFGGDLIGRRALADVTFYW